MNEKLILAQIAQATGISEKSLKKSWEAYCDNQADAGPLSLVEGLQDWRDELTALKRPFGIAPATLRTAFEAPISNLKTLCAQ